MLLSEKGTIWSGHVIRVRIEGRPREPVSYLVPKTLEEQHLARLSETHADIRGKDKTHDQDNYKISQEAYQLYPVSKYSSEPHSRR